MSIKGLKIRPQKTLQNQRPSPALFGVHKGVPLRTCYYDIDDPLLRRHVQRLVQAIAESEKQALDGEAVAPLN